MARPGQMKADVQEDTIIFIKSAGKGIDAANVPANIAITGNCELQSCCYLSLWSQVLVRYHPNLPWHFFGLGLCLVTALRTYGILIGNCS